MMAQCTTEGCGNTLGPRNKSGNCRSCTAKRINADPLFRARQADGVRAKMANDHVYRAACQKRAAALFARPDIRAKAREGVLRCRNWEKATAAITPEALAKRGRTLTAIKLAHVPTDYRDLYRFLRRTKRLSIADATKACLDQQAADKRAMHREWGVAA